MKGEDIMAASKREYRILPAPIDYFVTKLRSIPASGLGYSVVGERPIANGIAIALSHSISFSSWGENITVMLTSQGSQTVVDITSECSMPTQIVDWGKNAENIQRIFLYLQSNMPVNAQPQQAYSQPQQTAVVCPTCGKQLNDTFVFCDNCGTRLK